MKYAKLGASYILRLERGEEVLEQLVSFASREGISAGVVAGIGAVEDITLGYFDVEEKKYVKENLKGSYEVVSLNGTASLSSGHPLFHIHAVLADREHRTRGGHLFSARVSVTLEVDFRVLPGELKRAEDSFSRLNLLDLPESTG